jgi:mycothiol synthase
MDGGKIKSFNDPGSGLRQIVKEMHSSNFSIILARSMKTIDLNQLTIRSFIPDQDIPAVLSLYQAVEAIDREGKDINEQALRAQLELPGHDPGNDRWLVVSPDDTCVLIASALVHVAPGSAQAEANIIVHPAWRHLGIGSLLLPNILQRARQLSARSVEIYANTAHPAATAFLHKHAFMPEGAYTEMRLTTYARLPPIIWPYGYTMRTYAEVQNLSTLTEAMNLSYIPLWGHYKATEEQMSGWLPGFNQQGLFLVFSEKGRVIGVSRTEPSPERTSKNGVPTGYIDAPGIVPQHRRLDLYRALLLTGINWLRGQGQKIIELESWGDKLEVLKMYRQLGFEDIRQLVCYKMEIS